MENEARCKRPNEKEIEALNMFYERFYQLYDEILDEDFTEKEPEIRFYMLKEAFSLYKEISNYEPLKYYLKWMNNGGRYITLDNINHDKNVELRNEDRYGRFTVDLANRNIYLTGNGTDSLLGKYRIKLFKLDFNWEEKKITTKAYHMLKGEIIFQFEAIE